MRLAHVLGELQKETREPSFDAPSGQLRETVGQLHEPVRQPDQEAANHGGGCLEQREERLARDEQAGGRFERDRARRVGTGLVDRHGAHRIARAEDLEDHVRAARRGLEDFHAAGDRPKIACLRAYPSQFAQQIKSVELQEETIMKRMMTERFWILNRDIGHKN